MTFALTAYPDHAAEIVVGVTVRDYGVIISLGGDGTTNGIVNGLIDSNPLSASSTTKLPAIATISVNSTSVLAGAPDIPRDLVDAARYVASLLCSRVRNTISAGYVAGQCFVINAGTGIDAEVTSAMEQLRQNGTRVKAVRCLPAIFAARNRLRKSPSQITATVDGREFGRDFVIAVVSDSNPRTFPGDLPIVASPTVSVRRGLGFYGFTSLKGVMGPIATASLAGFSARSCSPLHVETRERRVNNIQHIKLTATTPLRLQLGGEYINQHESLNVRVKQGATDFVTRVDDYTEDRLTKKAVTRPMDKHLLVVVIKRVMDHTRRPFSVSQKIEANPT